MPASIATAAMLGLIVCNCASGLWGQSGNSPVYRVDVNLVTFTFSVMDAQGNSVHGLQPSGINVFEDGIPQKLASFAEGNKPIVNMLSGGQISAGTNVFILFDTSDRMYHNLPYVCDSIADFLRHLNPADAVAIYTFSRNLSRAVPLTSDHHLARAGLAQNVSAGEDTALLNCLLLTLRDAAKTPGRKVVVVFSNGPDDRSMVSPEDVGRVAEDEGIPIYVISTLDVSKEQQMGHTLKRLAERTGGKLYLARNWQAQAHAFSSVHDDISSSYTVSYYPAPNPNEGFRNIKVEVVAPPGKTYRIRARAGYQPRKPLFARTN
jgi:Ca-activated chloride channel homolog